MEDCLVYVDGDGVLRFPADAAEAGERPVFRAQRARLAALCPLPGPVPDTHVPCGVCARFLPTDQFEPRDCKQRSIRCRNCQQAAYTATVYLLCRRTEHVQARVEVEQDGSCRVQLHVCPPCSRYYIGSVRGCTLLGRMLCHWWTAKTASTCPLARELRATAWDEWDLLRLQDIPPAYAARLEEAFFLELTAPPLLRPPLNAKAAALSMVRYDTPRAPDGTARVHLCTDRPRPDGDRKRREGPDAYRRYLREDTPVSPPSSPAPPALGSPDWALLGLPPL